MKTLIKKTKLEEIKTNTTLINAPFTTSKSKRLASLRIWQKEALVLVFYLLVALVFTWPLILHFSEGVPGQDGGHDNWQMVWNLWWFRYAIEHFQNPFHTTLIFWPEGTDLYLHALNALNGFLSLPVQYLFGWGDTGSRGAIAGYNFIVLFSLVIGAFGAFKLALWLWKDTRAALLAGLAYGFSTYQFDHLLGHLNLISSEFIPFYILFLFRTLSVSSNWIKPAFVAVVFLVFNTFLELQYVLYLAIFSLLCLLYLTITFAWKQYRNKNGLKWINFLKQTWLRAIFIALIFVIVTLPFSLNALHDALTNPNIVPPHQDEIYSADLLAYFYPSPFQPVWGSAIQNAIRPFTAPLIEKVVFPGYTVWILVVAGLGLWVGKTFGRSQKKFSISRLSAENVSTSSRTLPVFSSVGIWLCTALVFVLLSFGAKLHINGQEFGPTLPAALIYKLPILNITRVPSRFAVIALLALALLAARSLSLFLRVLKNSQQKNLLTVAILLVLGFELSPIPYPFSFYSVPDFYRSLAQDPANNYAVLDIPLNTGSFQYDTTYLEAQMTHHKPLLGGYISRNPEYPPFLGVPVFNEWRNFVTSPSPDILPTQPPDLNILRFFKVGYVVIHKNSLNGKQRDAALGLAAKLFPEGPVYDKEGLVAYRVIPLETQVTPEFYYPNATDWYAAEGKGEQVSRWAFTENPALKFWVNSNKTMHVDLPLWSFRQFHTVEILLNGNSLVKQQVGTTPQNLSLNLNLHAGENTITLKISGPKLIPQKLGLGPDTRELTIAIGQVKITPSS